MTLRAITRSMGVMSQLIPAFSSLFLPIILGLVCRFGNYIDRNNRPIIQLFAVRVAVPCLVFESIRNVNIQTAGQLVPVSMALLIFSGIAWLLCWLAVTLLSTRSQWVASHKAELIIMGSSGNVGYICWKLHELLIGAEGLQRGIFYTTFFWPSLLLYSFLTVFALKLHQQQKMDRKIVLYNIVPLMSMIGAGLLIGLYEIQLPVWLSSFTGSFSAMAVPIILFCMGLSISIRRSTREALTAVPFLLIRFAFWIITVIIMLQIPVYDDASRKVLVVLAFAPLGVTALAIGDMFGLDTDFIASMTAISTVYFLILLPLLFMFWPAISQLI